MRQISTQVRNAAITARIEVRFIGVRDMRMPTAPSISCMNGSCVPSGKFAVSGAIDPGTFITLTSR